jgi:hypothetical protein
LEPEAHGLSVSRSASRPARFGEQFFVDVERFLHRFKLPYKSGIFNHTDARADACDICATISDSACAQRVRWQLARCR